MKRLIVALLALLIAHPAWADFAYSNNGQSFRAVDPGYQPQPGEVVFPTYATPQQLTSAFPGYAAAVAAQQAQASFASALATGLAVSSTGTPAFSATFALDPTTQSELAGIAGRVALTGTFPGGGTSYAFPDINGAQVSIPTVALFKNFFAAYGDYLQALNQAAAIAQAGGAWSPPSSTKTIP